MKEREKGGSEAMPMNGKELLKRFLKAGWRRKGQKGSHIQVEKGALHETIPMHKELAKGTERYLLKILEKSQED
jgi:predicted RNA binding protein YcfA (HicA-like mRNA interferase family)